MTSSRGRRWTPDEDALIKAATWDGYPRPRSLARQLGRTAKAVMLRAAVLRKSDTAVRWATLRGPTRPWTRPQEAELRRRAETEPLAMVAATLGRTLYACKSKLGSRRRKLRWTKSERQRLAELLASGAKVAEIAEALGRSGPAVKGQLQGSKPYRKPWTAADDAAIIDGAATRTSMTKLAEQLGRSVNAVRVRANRLRVKGAAAAWLKGSPNRRDWTTKALRELIAMRERGEPYSKIAEVMGRTPDACKRAFAKHRNRGRT